MRRFAHLPVNSGVFETMSENVKKLLDNHEDFIKNLLKKQKDIVPQIISCKNNEITIGMIMAGREGIKATLSMVQRTKPDWIVFFTGAYMETKKIEDGKDFIEKHYPGSLDKRFNSGDKSVSEVIILQAYTKTDKIMRMIDKKTLKKIQEDAKDFDGYLAINDVDRVFW